VSDQIGTHAPTLQPSPAAAQPPQYCDSPDGVCGSGDRSVSRPCISCADIADHLHPSHILTPESPVPDRGRSCSDPAGHRDSR
jgi:hypothetical protein